MPVFRINKTRDYTVMSNWHLKDRELSLKAKGLLSIILSLPDGWDYSINGLCAICIENESAVKSALKELKARGYLRVDKLMPDKTATGRIKYEYNIFEQPREKQEVENLPLEIQGVENPGQLSTNESSTNKLSTKDKKVSKKEAHASRETPHAKQPAFDTLIDSYTDDEELREALRGFVQMRCAMRKRPTNRALELLFQKLDSLAGDTETKIAILNQSILNGWQGVFPLKDEESRKSEKKDDGPKPNWYYG